MLLVPAAAAQPSCLRYIPPPLFDTSWNPEASPSNPRVHGVDLLQWGRHRYLVYNTGNEVALRLYNAPGNPGAVHSTAFHVVNGGPVNSHGDRDYNLFDFTVCDRCPVGVAGYDAMGAVLFELELDGDGDLVTDDFAYYPQATVSGAFTFRHGAQQYMVMNGLPDTCGSATLYAIDGILETDRQVLQCLERLGGGVMTVDGGFYIPDGGDGFSYVYLLDERLDVVMYRITGTGADLRLNNLGALMRAAHMSLDLDGPAAFPRLAITGGIWGLEIWDLQQPANPTLLAYWDPNPALSENRTAIRYPYGFATARGFNSPDATFLFDISDPINPQLLEPDFWTVDIDHPWNTYSFIANQDAVITDDADWLIFSRYSVLQTFRIPCSLVFADDFESGDLDAWARVAGGQ
jgi:hypothetical protein